MEMMVKDKFVIDFLQDFQVATVNQLKVLVNATTRTLVRLEKLRLVTIKEQIVEITGSILSPEEKKGVIGILDIFAVLHKRDEIDGYYRMDLPYVAAAVKNQEFYYFIFVKQGEEKLQSKIINHENRGNLVLVLEKKEQLIQFDKYPLEEKMSNIYFLEDLKV